MKKIIKTDSAPAAIGAYSQAVQVDKTVYLSGQIPLDPKTMTLVDGDFVAQAKQVFDNLRAVANAAGGGLNDIVKLTVYLTDFSHYASLNEVMSAYFTAPYPARAAIQVSALPKGAIVEVDGILVLG